MHKDTKLLISLLFFIVVTFTALLFTNAADAGQNKGLVLRVDPIYTSVVRYERVAAQETICEDVRQARRSDGLIEYGTNGIFGSRRGLVGTAVGVAIGSQIGGGSGTDVAMVLGGLLGNSVGNESNRNRQNSRLYCHEVVSWVSVPQIESELQYFNVLVDIQGQRFTVKRYTAPNVGEMIPININVR